MQHSQQLPFSPESDHSTDSLDSYSESLIDGKKNYSCLAPNCGKVFKFKSEIKRHVIIHGKERPFVCTFPGCKKTFKRADALGNHVKLHEKPSAFDCPIPGCKVQLTTKAGLQYHLSKHGEEEEEEVFRCNVPGCNQTFLTYKHLSHHERSTHYANANASPMLTMKRAPSMNDGLESFMMGSKKLAVQSYLGPNPIKYEQEDNNSIQTSSDSDGAKGEFNIRLIQQQPAFIQPPPTLNFEDTMKSALIGQLAENQRLKKEFMLTMNFLQGNIRNNNQVRNQAFLTSAYQSLMQPLSI